jgi:hypothetical protein
MFGDIVAQNFTVARQFMILTRFPFHSAVVKHLSGSTSQRTLKTKDTNKFGNSHFLTKPSLNLDIIDMSALRRIS